MHGLFMVMSMGFTCPNQSRVTPRRCHILSTDPHDVFNIRVPTDQSLMFKFTFNVNGSAFNPFAQTEKRDGPQVVVPQTIARKLPAPPRPCLPATDDGAPISRKRGWTPMTSAPSAPESQPMQTTGWIDTPSRYLEAASQSHQNRGDVDGGESFSQR